MARNRIVAFQGQFDMTLERMLLFDEDGVERILQAGAKVMCDEIRKRINALPEEPFRHLTNGQKFAQVPHGHKRVLQKHLGITPMDKDDSFRYNINVGFGGYDEGYPTKKYPGGVPAQLIARAIESGSSVRQKHPFVAPAQRARRKAAYEAMEQQTKKEFGL